MKKVLITGGCSGLGWEMTQQAIWKWYGVDVIDISIWEKHWDDFPENLHFFQGDITHISQDFIENLWVYDMVICNAGISLSGDFLEHESSKNMQIIQVNALWHMELVRLLLKNNKIKAGWNIGCIISASVMLPFPIALGYAASKGALESFAMALRSYLIGRKISVSCVYPGPMPTAHVKYYNQEQKYDEKSLKKVQKIAAKSFRCIEKKKRSIYPDISSKAIRIFSPFWIILDKIMYRAYKKEFQK